MSRPATGAATVARGALCGFLGGLAAGAIEFALAAERAQAFLPSGRTRLLVFLCTLYGAAGGALGALGVAAARALGWATDLEALWHGAFAEAGSGGQGAPGATRGRRWAAYAAAVVLVSAGHVWVVRELALYALTRFHHRLLIAGLVGAEAALLAVPAAALVFLLAAVLSPVLRFGPRLAPRPAAPAGLYAAAWVLGLAGGAGVLAQILVRLEAARRLSHPQRAAAAAWWAPLCLLGGLVVAHLVARLLARRVRPRVLHTPAGAAAAIVATLAALVVPAAALQWSTVRQLDRRPFVAAATLVLVALICALAGAGRGLAKLRGPARAAFAVALPALALSLALSVGRSDRVRKAASQLTGLTTPIVRALHAATDLDRDGYASILGGGDCDDFDRDVHPGALDWPDDGVDQDCNGHAATLAPRPPRRHLAHTPTVDKPNVLLITLDALRADHVSAYGYRRPTTPHLDALAQEGVLFKNAWAHAPSTRYSIPAILTGRYPSTIAVGAANWPPNLLPENRLAAEILKDLGYKTAALLSYHYFSRGWAIDQGFDDYDYSLQTLHSMGGDPAKTQGSSARQLADKNIAWIAEHKAERFFLWTHFYDTHFMFERHPDLPEADFGSDELALYDGEIRFSDHHIGRIFDALKREGLWDRTIVIVTSDHGEGFGEHGLPPSQRHGYHLYRNETQVPLIIRVPGLRPRVVDEPVGHIDILPTLLNLLGQPAGAEPQLLGDSVLDLMLGTPVDDKPRRIYQEVWYEGPTSRKAVVESGWHYIRNLIPDDTAELYDLGSDPEETRDRAGDGTAVEARLRTALAAWMDQAALPADFKRRVEGNVSQTPIPFSHPLGARLGQFISVEGYDLNDGEIAFVLRGLARPPQGWRFFMHIIGPDGRRLNADHEPVENLYPVTRLRPGTWLRDRVKLAVPPGWPEGPLTIDLGLWKGTERAAATGPHAAGDKVRVVIPR